MITIKNTIKFVLESKQGSAIMTDGAGPLGMDVRALKHMVMGILMSLYNTTDLQFLHTAWMFDGIHLESQFYEELAKLPNNSSWKENPSTTPYHKDAWIQYAYTEDMPYGS